MKLGTLIDQIRRLEAAEEDVEHAEVRLRHGGSLGTLAAKRDRISRAEAEVDRLRDQEVGEE